MRDEAWADRLEQLDQDLAAYGAGGGVETGARGAGGAPAGPAVQGDVVGDDVVEPDDEATTKQRRAFFDWVVVIGVALFVAFLVRTFVLAHFVVYGV